MTTTNAELFRAFLKDILNINPNDFEPLDDIDAGGCWGFICPKYYSDCKKCKYYNFWNKEIKERKERKE